LTVSVPSVNSAYSAESTDGTLTKSATKTVLCQYSKIQNIPISGAGAEPVRPVRCFVTPSFSTQVWLLFWALGIVLAYLAYDAIVLLCRQASCVVAASCPAAGTLYKTFF